MIKLKLRRGEVILKARPTPEVPPMAFHFRETCTNWLTNAAYPVSQTAEYKACAVRIEKLSTEERALITAGHQAD